MTSSTPTTTNENLGTEDSPKSCRPAPRPLGDEQNPCAGYIPLPPAAEIPDGPWYPRIRKKPDGTFSVEAVPDGDDGVGTGTGSGG